MTTRDLTFAGSTGTTLAGVLHVPDDEARGSILLAHCFTCSKDLHTMTRLARGLADAGYAVLRFDFTGLGDSTGEFATTTVANDVRDITAATSALIERGYGPCGLLGHSLGGAASLLAAARLHTVRSVVTIGAPSSPSHVRHLFEPAGDAGDDGSERGNSDDENAGDGDDSAGSGDRGGSEDGDDGRDEPGRATVPVVIGGRRFEVARAFLDDLDRHDQDGAVADLDRPLLVIHAVDDEVVDVSEGERIFAAARQPKAFHPLLGADHLLTDRAVAGRALHLARDWFDTTL